MGYTNEQIGRAKAEFRNESGLEFIDISSERFRVYNCVNGEVLRVDDPVYLHISESGGHRIYTASGRCYYVKPCVGGWWITWQPREGAPHFVK